ncbi:TPA: PapB/FocB family fimbrial expression transcriptional regulator, partial [Escherichia coli]
EDKIMKTDNSYIITSAFKKRNSRCPYCVLEAGKVPEEQFWLLIDISSIHSQRIINALYDYIVEGASRKVICERHNINNGYFTTCLKKLNYINKVISELSRFYTDEIDYE